MRSEYKSTRKRTEFVYKTDLFDIGKMYINSLVLDKLS